MKWPSVRGASSASATPPQLDGQHRQLSFPVRDAETIKSHAEHHSATSEGLKNLRIRIENKELKDLSFDYLLNEFEGLEKFWIKLEVAR